MSDFLLGIIRPGEENNSPGWLHQQVGDDRLELGLVSVGRNLLLDSDADVLLGRLVLKHLQGNTQIILTEVNEIFNKPKGKVCSGSHFQSIECFIQLSVLWLL